MDEVGQDFRFAGFSDGILSEVGRVRQKQLHFDADAILRAYENIKPLAKRLGVEPPVPRLGDFCYTHIAALGAEFVFPDDAEPKPFPIIHGPEEIDKLTEPKDYLAAPLIRERLKILRELKKLCPETLNSIGHKAEGPITTAVLIMGHEFFTLLYDEPKRAHRLLRFCVRSTLNYARVITAYFGETIQPGFCGIPDDFAGMLPPDLFEEFVVPYWEEVYQGYQATERGLHSELLRAEHLRFLKMLKIGCYDPGADQHLTPEILRERCPCKFQGNIQDWHVHDLSTGELEALYRQIAGTNPYVITFSMSRLADEVKIKHLLGVARGMTPEIK